MRHVLMVAFVLFAVPMVGFAQGTPPVPASLFDADGFFDGTVECIKHATYDEDKGKCHCDDGYEGVEVEVDANENVPKCQLTTANRALYGVYALIPRVDGLEASVAELQETTANNTSDIETLQTQREEDSALAEIRYAVQVETNELISQKIETNQAENAATNDALADLGARVVAVEAGLGTVQADVVAVETDVDAVEVRVTAVEDRPVALFGLHAGTMLGLWSSPTMELVDGNEELVRYIGHPMVAFGLHVGNLRHSKGVVGQFDIGFGPSKGGYDAAGSHDMGLELALRISADYAFPLGRERRGLGLVGPTMLMSFADLQVFEDQATSVGMQWGAGFTWMPPTDTILGIGLGADLTGGLVDYDYKPGPEYEMRDETKFALGLTVRIVMTLDPR